MRKEKSFRQMLLEQMDKCMRKNLTSYARINFIICIKIKIYILGLYLIDVTIKGKTTRILEENKGK